MVTLTYNKENLPKDGNIHKRHIQLFMKRLRKHVEPKKISYFCCGEYGEKFGRPHYHLLIFNYDWPDKELFEGRWIKRSRHQFKDGPNYSLYTSKELSKIWTSGFSLTGAVNLQSAGYVARYITKKITGKGMREHYGEKRTPEFALMSRRPAIGLRWIEKYLTDVYPKDYFTIEGIKYRPPRFYDTILEKRKPKMWEQVKLKRKDYAGKRGLEISIEAWNREKYRKCITKRLERKMENE